MIHLHHCPFNPPYPNGMEQTTGHSTLHIIIKGSGPLTSLSGQSSISLSKSVPSTSLLGQPSISMSKGGVHRPHCSVKPPYPCRMEGSTDLTAQSNLHIHVEGMGPPTSLLGKPSISMSKGGVHRPHCPVKPPYPCRREGPTDLTAR